ncbi:MAG: FAD-dependent oxidoreductase, partial [Verrucomicrobia bacterium]|nr:FAD-dependent oxidoreductase [Verrucomicrobiota bacterium]
LGRYVAERGYGEDFLHFYLVPMSAAVWSTPPERMLDFPAMTLLRFFHNHGFLGLHTQHPWRTVTGGAKAYVGKILAPLRERVRLRSPVARVERLAPVARVTTADGRSKDFDKVILACHGDQSLRLLADADAQERTLLGEFQYQRNLATLHTDASVMPRARLAWASWNYRIEHAAAGRVLPSTIYWMNSLQGVSDRENYFVSINGTDRIAPERVLKRIEYEHPLFSLGAIRAQAELPKLNQRSSSQARGPRSVRAFTSAP